MAKPQSAATAVRTAAEIPAISEGLSFDFVCLSVPFPLPKRLKNICLEVLKIANYGRHPRQIQQG